MMSRLKALYLSCVSVGAAAGYWYAGFNVVGVGIKEGIQMQYTEHMGRQAITQLASHSVPTV